MPTTVDDPPVQGPAKGWPRFERHDPGPRDRLRSSGGNAWVGALLGAWWLGTGLADGSAFSIGFGGYWWLFAAYNLRRWRRVRAEIRDSELALPIAPRLRDRCRASAAASRQAKATVLGPAGRTRGS